MRHLIFAGLAGVLLLGAQSGAQAQQFKTPLPPGVYDTSGGDPALEREKRRQMREQGGAREARRERRGEVDRFDRRGEVDRFERRGDFDRGERRVIVRERYREPTVVVRPPRARTVCTTRVRERVTPGGVVIRRPVEVCRQVIGAGPRF